MPFEWIKNNSEGIAEEDLYFYIDKNMQELSQCIFLAYYTDRIECNYYCNFDTSDIAHLLEIRIFNEDCEFRGFRVDMERPFICRIADDNFFKYSLEQLKKNSDCQYTSFELQFKNRIFKEEHYIDSVNTIKNQYMTAGGGIFTLPIENAEKIQIQNYINYHKDTGNAMLEDWRIVKFLEKSPEGGEING